LTDEVHQLSVPGRDGTLFDVAIDGVGILVGSLVPTSRGIPRATAPETAEQKIPSRDPTGSFRGRSRQSSGTPPVGRSRGARASSG
jgi:hypothetical protein